MKLWTQLCLMVFLFIGCYPDEYESIAIELQGDWIGDKDEEIMMIYQDQMTQGAPSYIKQFATYEIHDNKTLLVDTISVMRSKGIKKYPVGLRYEVDYLVNDTLRLIKYYKRNPEDTEELNFIRLNPIYGYDFRRLSISGSPCYGGCPIFDLEVDFEGHVKFKGNGYTTRIGNYMGELNPNQLELVSNQVNTIDWEDLDPVYWEAITDIQYFNIELEDKDGNIFRLVTNSPQTKSVNILINKLFGIIEQMELRSTTSELEFSTDLIQFPDVD